MDLYSANATSKPHIKCSDCSSEIPFHLIAEHTCNEVATTSFSDDQHQTYPQRTLSLAAQHASIKNQRQFMPRIDSSAASSVGSHEELTPASSGSESAAASPISPNRFPPIFPPKRKASMPIRRPPSPELLSQDCAFPPFPTTKSKKEGTKKVRGRTKTPDGSRPKLSEHDRLRSASVGAQKSRLRHEITDSSRPSTASSSRSTSRHGSFDAVPPLPHLQKSSSHHASDDQDNSRQPSQGSVGSLTMQSLGPDTSIPGETTPLSQFLKNEDMVKHENPTTLLTQNPQNDMLQSVSHAREPSYRAKRPPPIVHLQPHVLDESVVSKPEPSPSLPPPPPTPTGSLARTLTNLFSRKRGQSTSSKKGGLKSPAIDGPRFVALSPEPDPLNSPAAERSQHSSLSTEMVVSPPIHGLQEGPQSSVDVTAVTYQIPEPLQAHITVSEEATEEPVQTLSIHVNHDPIRDTVQMERDFENRLAAITGAPTVAVINESSEDVKRASIDSASSYGSIGFSHSSTSSTSFQRFEGHSHGSSISTARTMSSSDDAFVSNFHKIRSFTSDPAPDSPTDPYLQHGRLRAVPAMASSMETEEDEEDIDVHLHNSRLSTVHEVLSSPEEERPEPVLEPFKPNTDHLHSESADSSFGKSSAQTSSTASISEPEPNRLELPQQSAERRPSTPGAVRGTCRGCSQRILSGQKSVSSKDGRLSGRYHKACFVCMTCKQPFATADFYVHNDHPYCAHHYHVLNETLCESCGKGIEGHYLETSNVSGNGAKKFHPQCLRCATCKLHLQDEYFELGNRVYCEKDAFRLVHGGRSPYGTAPSRPSPLNREYISSGEPGQVLAAGRFPERRLTRLMTTH